MPNVPQIEITLSPPADLPSLRDSLTNVASVASATLLGNKLVLTCKTPVDAVHLGQHLGGWLQNWLTTANRHAVLTAGAQSCRLPGSGSATAQVTSFLEQSLRTFGVRTDTTHPPDRR